MSTVVTIVLPPRTLPDGRIVTYVSDEDTAGCLTCQAQSWARVEGEPLHTDNCLTIFDREARRVLPP